MKIIHPEVSYISLSSVAVGDCFLKSGFLFIKTNGYLTEFTLSFSHDDDDRNVVCVNLVTGRIQSFRKDEQVRLVEIEPIKYSVCPYTRILNLRNFK